MTEWRNNYAQNLYSDQQSLQYQFDDQSTTNTFVEQQMEIINRRRIRGDPVIQTQSSLLKISQDKMNIALKGQDQRYYNALQKAQRGRWANFSRQVMMIQNQQIANRGQTETYYQQEMVKMTYQLNKEGQHQIQQLKQKHQEKIREQCKKIMKNRTQALGQLRLKFHTENKQKLMKVNRQICQDKQYQGRKSKQIKQRIHKSNQQEILNIFNNFTKIVYEREEKAEQKAEEKIKIIGNEIQQKNKHREQEYEAQIKQLQSKLKKQNSPKIFGLPNQHQSIPKQRTNIGGRPFSINISNPHSHQ